ncbi:MAG: hypothetical protein DRQ88_00855 [Epsilonproteobacteria bacterium]|nr:MAG: hypothetical protein DRQ89_11040 [Campylobacterota bacterium]RLA68184.1 MAG: hypothetical protein DRQ88_00855 [Campylobacterota bacterium]
MNKLFLILPLATLLFATQGWAPPPEKGGAAAFPTFHSKKCDLRPQEQTKIALQDKKGKTHYVCTGMSVCAGKAVPVSCKISEREACPIAKKCFPPEKEILITYYGNCNIVQFKTKNNLYFIRKSFTCQVQKGFIVFSGSRPRKIFIISSWVNLRKLTEREDSVKTLPFMITLTENQVQKHEFDIQISNVPTRGIGETVNYITENSGDPGIDIEVTETEQEIKIKAKVNKTIRTRKDEHRGFEILKRSSSDPLNIDLVVKKESMRK